MVVKPNRVLCCIILFVSLVLTMHKTNAIIKRFWLRKCISRKQKTVHSRGPATKILGSLFVALKFARLLIVCFLSTNT